MRRRNPAPGLDPNKPITRAQYPAIFGDSDHDQIPDVDDPRPRRPGDRHSIEEVRLADEMDALLATRQEFMPVLDEVKDRLGSMQIPGASIAGRVKTPFSIINKLRRKRLATLTDVAGAMMVVPDQATLDHAAQQIENDFDVIEREDFYADPQNGYRALHYIVRVDGKPVELQLKTQRMFEISNGAHTAYKRGQLDPEAMERMTALAWDADRGDAKAAREIDRILADPQSLRKQLAVRKNNPSADPQQNPRQREIARRLASGAC